MSSSEREKPTSNLIFELYSEPNLYSVLLEKYVHKYLSIYDNKNLQKCFQILPYKFISICPMALCDSLLRDLKKECLDEELAALGFVMFGISMHDDIVDEMFDKRQTISDLLFAGNIACNEGIKFLAQKNKVKEIDCLLSIVNENHFYQQHNIYTLWQEKPKNIDEYIDGLKHVVAFMRIGLEYGLTIANDIDLKPNLKDFAVNYGLGIQLLDDLREVKEDQQKGYYSYPAIEGEPYKETYKNAVLFADNAVNSLPREWTNLKQIAENLKKVITLNYKNNFTE